MTFQCAEVNKALGSVSQIVHKGSRVVFDESGSYIQDKASGSRLWLEEQNGVFVLSAYVAPHSLHSRVTAGFPRQGP